LGITSAAALAFYTIYPARVNAQILSSNCPLMGACFLGGLIMVPIMKTWEIQGIWMYRLPIAFDILSFPERDVFTYF